MLLYSLSPGAPVPNIQTFLYKPILQVSFIRNFPITLCMALQMTHISQGQSKASNMDTCRVMQTVHFMGSVQWWLHRLICFVIILAYRPNSIKHDRGNIPALMIYISPCLLQASNGRTTQHKHYRDFSCHCCLCTHN